MNEVNSSNKLMSITDFPRVIIPNQFIVVEYHGTEKEYIVSAYDSEIEAYKIYKRIKNNDKAVIKGNGIYSDMFGLKALIGYEEIKD